MTMKILGLVLAVGAGTVLWVGTRDSATDLAAIHVYKSPTCGCCVKWVDHLREQGFEVTVEDVVDMTAVKSEAGVPTDLSSCHTAKVGDYLLEGHVPGHAIKDLLAEAPDIKGLAVPGMPIGSPGMEGPNARGYDVMAFDAAGNRGVFQHITP